MSVNKKAAPIYQSLMLVIAGLMFFNLLIFLSCINHLVPELPKLLAPYLLFNNKPVIEQFSSVAASLKTVITFLMLTMMCFLPAYITESRIAKSNISGTVKSKIIMALVCVPLMCIYLAQQSFLRELISIMIGKELIGKFLIFPTKTNSYGALSELYNIAAFLLLNMIPFAVLYHVNKMILSLSENSFFKSVDIKRLDSIYELIKSYIIYFLPFAGTLGYYGATFPAISHFSTVIIYVLVYLPLLRFSIEILKNALELQTDNDEII